MIEFRESGPVVERNAILTPSIFVWGRQSPVFSVGGLCFTDNFCQASKPAHATMPAYVVKMEAEDQTREESVG